MSALDRLARFRVGKRPADVDRALRHVIRTAHEGVPYYREAWSEAGVDPTCVRTSADLPRLPVTTRRPLLEGGERRMLHRNADPTRTERSTTSGSTTLPMTVHMSRSEAFYRRLTVLLALGRRARLRFPLHIVDVGTFHARGSRNVAVRLGLVRVTPFDRWMPVLDQADALLRSHPDVLQGRPSCLAQLALELDRRGERPPPVRLIACFGEVLHAPVAGLIGSVFGRPPVDYYNCDEIGNVAWECDRDPSHLHVNHDTCVVEIVDDAGEPAPAGRVGRVIVTSLYNCTMPFIRYDLGDRAILEPSPACGRPGTALRAVEGRDDDFFRTADGRLISPRIVFQAAWESLPVDALGGQLFRSIRALQIVQERVDTVIVRVEPGVDYDPGVWQGLDDGFRRLDPALRVSVEEVDRLPRDPSGKLRQVISRVGTGPADIAAAPRRVEARCRERG